jgi:hypothetical protein
VRRAVLKTPPVTSLTAASSYLVKILALFFLLVRYIGTTAFNGKPFCFTVVRASSGLPV